VRHRAEARAILESELAALEGIPYEKAAALMTRKRRSTVRGRSGTDYSVVVHSFPDSPGTGVLRVMVDVDDGGWSAFVPMTGDLLVAPDDTA